MTPDCPPSIPAIYDRLHRAFGPQHWWPAETPWEVIVGAILTQSAAWTNVEKAIANLQRRRAAQRGRHRRRHAGGAGAPGLPLRLLQRQGAQAQGLCRPRAGPATAATWRPCWPGPSRSLRPELLAIHGVGPETADSIILYAAGQPVFVVDAYTRRIAARLGLCGDKATYDELQALFTCESAGRGRGALQRVPRPPGHPRQGALPQAARLRRLPAAADLCPTGAAMRLAAPVDSSADTRRGGSEPGPPPRHRRQLPTSASLGYCSAPAPPLQLLHGRIGHRHAAQHRRRHHAGARGSRCRRSPPARIAGQARKAAVVSGE